MQPICLLFYLLLFVFLLLVCFSMFIIYILSPLLLRVCGFLLLCFCFYVCFIGGLFFILDYVSIVVPLLLSFLDFTLSLWRVSMHAFLSWVRRI